MDGGRAGALWKGPGDFCGDVGFLSVLYQHHDSDRVTCSGCGDVTGEPEEELGRRLCIMSDNACDSRGRLEGV